MEERLRAVVFDLDGTLLDTLEDLAAAANWALRQNGMPERTLDEVRQFVGNGVRRLMARAVPDGEANPLFEQTFADFKRYYVVHCQDKTRVDELYERYFRDTVTVAVGERPGMQRKPAPDMVNLALRELGVTTEEAVYVGDSDVDLQTAANSGLPCISVLWGFRDRDFLLAHGATQFAATPTDVVSVLSHELP